MAIDFKTFSTVVGIVTDARYPVLIRGRHGIGKSETVYQYAEKVGLPIVERRASQMSEGDLVGLPVIDGDSTGWNPPDWYKRACREAVVLFMDELDRATTEVRQGFFQLADSRTLNGHRLHPDTLLFAAVNGGVHGSQYQVSDMDPAELDRWTVYDLEPSVEDWVSYASDNNRVNPIVVDFIRHNHGHLEHSKDFEPGKVYPSRRSWERLSRAIDGRAMLADEYKGNLEKVFVLACGFVGLEAAIAFRDHAERYENMVSPADILKSGARRTADFKLNDHVTMVEKLLVYDGLVGDMSDESFNNFIEYLLSMPAEAIMKFYTSMNATKEKLPVILRIHKNETARKHIVTILAGAKKKA